MLASLTTLEPELRDRLGEAVLEFNDNHGQVIVRVPPDERPRALSVLKSLGLTFYSFNAAVDYLPEEGEEAKPGRLDILDHVYSISEQLHVTLKCEIGRDEPRIPTAIEVYAGANWHERETWELFGVIFVGHPQLRRLLLPDWQEGFPMRKDHELRARVEKPWPGDFFSG